MQDFALHAYDRRIEVLESQLKTVLAILTRKELTQDETKAAEKAAEVLNAGK